MGTPILFLFSEGAGLDHGGMRHRANVQRSQRVTSNADNIQRSNCHLLSFWWEIALRLWMLSVDFGKCFVFPLLCIYSIIPSWIEKILSQLVRRGMAAI